jgi:tripartite-type tricarboxylate transporter receptor subunit TctC
MDNGFRLFTLAVALTAASLAIPQIAQAQSYPSRPITIIVPSPAGGGTDTMARLIGDQLSKQMGQAFVIENRPGAAGLIGGTQAVATAAPDGHTLSIGLNANMAVAVSMFAKLPYDPIRDFAPVGMLANYPFMVVVSNNLPVRSIKELVALAKAKPGEVNFASAGNGTGQHLAAELFKIATGINLMHVPYRGAQAAYTDVISGQVPVFFDNMSTAMSLSKAGTVRALAVTSKNRMPQMPEMPTVDESGVPGFEYHTWFGLWAPKKTPQAILERLNAEVRKALDEPALREKIAATSGQPSTMPLAEIEPFVQAEIAKWADVVKRAGVKVE